MKCLNLKGDFWAEELLSLKSLLAKNDTKCGSISLILGFKGGKISGYRIREDSPTALWSVIYSESES